MDEAEKRDWLRRAIHAISDDGSNDEEHDLLVEMMDEIVAEIGETGWRV